MNYLPHLCLMAFCLGVPCAVQAQPGLGDTATHEVGHWIAMSSPRQLVRIGDIELLFEADVTIRDRTNRGFGFVTIETEGSAIYLQPVGGGVDWRTGGVVLTFVPRIDREIGPNDLVIAVFQPSGAGGNDRLIVDSSWGLPFSLNPQPFEVAGTLSVSPHGNRVDPVDYGQLAAHISIETPLQAVDPLPQSNIVGIESKLRLSRNQTARGFLDIHLPRREPVSYEPIFGAAFPGDDEFLVRTIVVLLLADRQAPLNTNDHVLRATVDVERINPDCQLWQLLNGATGQVNGMFNAQGSLQLTSLNGNLQISQVNSP